MKYSAIGTSGKFSTSSYSVECFTGVLIAFLKYRAVGKTGFTKCQAFFVVVCLFTQEYPLREYYVLFLLIL